MWWVGGWDSFVLRPILLVSEGPGQGCAFTEAQSCTWPALLCLLPCKPGNSMTWQARGETQDGHCCEAGGRGPLLDSQTLTVPIAA